MQLRRAENFTTCFIRDDVSVFLTNWRAWKLQVNRCLTMDTKLLRLLHEVQRQLETPLKLLDQSHGSVNPGIFTTQWMYDNYRIELEQLREHLSGRWYLTLSVSPFADPSQE